MIPQQDRYLYGVRKGSAVGSRPTQRSLQSLYDASFTRLRGEKSDSGKRRLIVTLSVQILSWVNQSRVPLFPSLLSSLSIRITTSAREATRSGLFLSILSVFRERGKTEDHFAIPTD